MYEAKITISVPVVYTARYAMVLRRARNITRGIGRGGTWKYFLGPEMAASEANAIWALKSRVLELSSKNC